MLALLHPDGAAARTLVIGGGLPPVLAAGLPKPAPDEADLVVIAPTLRESVSRGWLAGATHEAAAALAPDGIVYALVPPPVRSRARRLLRAAGLEPGLELAHLPDAARSRHLVPVDSSALAYAFSILASGRRELAAGWLAVRVPPALLASALPAVGVVACRPGGRPPLDWLFRLDGDEPGLVLTSRAFHPRHRGVVLHRFPPRAPLPSAIAKLRLDPSGAARTLREADALERLGPAAREAGAAVPFPVAAGEVGGRPVRVQSAVTGRVAALALESGEARLDDVLDAVTGWLERWHRLTAAPGQDDPARLQRDVLAPARLVAPLVAGGDEYLEWLERRCDAAAGAGIARVAAHYDLTMWNVLLGEPDAVGVVDWEGAEEAGLPLADFYYAAADAVGAVRGYRDRPGAFASCFARDGDHAALVRRLHARLVPAVGLAPAEDELCFHACWLRQAADERRQARAADREPFLAIVRWLAGHREDVWVAAGDDVGGGPACA